MTLDTVPVAAPAGAVVTCAILAVSAPNAEAIPPRGAVRRTSRRTTRRVVRRHMYALPAGYRWATFGAYRYAFVGGAYYYPYVMQGQTVYVQVDMQGSQPAPPPPASQISAEIE